MSRVEGVIVDLENRVEHHGDDLLAKIANRYFEIVAMALENLGSQFKRGVYLCVPVVGLHQREGLCQGCAGDPKRADPMMNQSFGTLDDGPIIACFDPFD